MTTIADLSRFARRQDTLSGEMDTFSQALGCGVESGNIRYRVDGVSEDDGGPGVELCIDGEFIVTCQRCLESMTWPVSIQKFFRLAPENKLGEMFDKDELEDEDSDFLVIGKPLNVESLVEEMLVLEWPVSPKHDECELFI